MLRGGALFTSPPNPKSRQAVTEDTTLRGKTPGRACALQELLGWRNHHCLAGLQTEGGCALAVAPERAEAQE